MFGEQGEPNLNGLMNESESGHKASQVTNWTPPSCIITSLFYLRLFGLGEQDSLCQRPSGRSCEKQAPAVIRE